MRLKTADRPAKWKWDTVAEAFEAWDQRGGSLILAYDETSYDETSYDEYWAARFLKVAFDHLSSERGRRERTFMTIFPLTSVTLRTPAPHDPVEHSPLTKIARRCLERPWTSISAAVRAGKDRALLARGDLMSHEVGRQLVSEFNATAERLEIDVRADVYFKTPRNIVLTDEITGQPVV